jgi:uncharacterized protein (TIGR00255 family)
MTGFGRGVGERGGARATVDVRAVNHRFLDLKLRGSPVAPAVEEQLAARVRGSVERGAVTVSVHVDRPGGALRIDHEAARAAHVQLVQVARELAMEGPTLSLVLAQPGVVTADEAPQGGDAAVLAAIDAALAQLTAMRETEGQALALELTARLDDLARITGSIGERAKTMPDQLRRRLDERLRALGADVDPQRLAQEVALLADKADVTEELVRLASHVAQARTLIASKEPTGRRLDFLVQELGRELNTIGSKSAAAEISALVVEAKAVLEKVREQVQNVE